MFSKTRVTEPGPRNSHPDSDIPSPSEARQSPQDPAQTPRNRTVPSVLSADLTISGNLKTAGDVQIEGQVDGDIRARQLIVGETAIIRGELVADEVIVNGRVIGRVRGLKVRLSATARVEGDIIHKTIAIEAGAHFEGSVQRQDDPLSQGSTKKLAPPKTDFQDSKS